MKMIEPAGAQLNHVGRPERIAAILRKRITEHDLKPGDKLPSEHALAGHFGVSRTVVREAIARLKVEGLVETHQGSGAYVTSPETENDATFDSLTRSSVDMLLDLIEVRRVTEGEMAARAATVRTSQQMNDIDKALEAIRVADLDGRDGVAEDQAFHAAVAAATGNVYWSKLVSAFAKHVTVAMSVTRGNEAMRRDFAGQVGGEHQELRDAIAARDPERARNAAVRHMEMSSERLMNADRDFWRKSGAQVRSLPAAD